MTFTTEWQLSFKIISEIWEVYMAYGSYGSVRIHFLLTKTNGNNLIKKESFYELMGEFLVVNYEYKEL